MTSDPTTRLWFQKHTIEGRLPGLDRAYSERLPSLLQPDTTLEIHTLPPETYEGSLPEGFVRYGSIETLFAYYFAVQAVHAERDGADAFVIGTSQDPGLVEARSLVEIPVVGYGETAAHFASMLAPTFTFVGFIPELEEPIRTNMRRMGFSDRLSPFAYTEVGPEAIRDAFEGDSASFVDSFVAAARRAISDGAQILIPGEGLPNEILVAAGVTEVDGVPILDADGLVVKHAEFLVDMHRRGVLSRPLAGYHNRRPPTDELNRLVDLFAPDISRRQEES